MSEMHCDTYEKIDSRATKIKNYLIAKDYRLS